jgi:hypothetical protein
MDSEKGQALLLVMIALAIGALVLPSFLNHTGTSLIGSRAYRQEIGAQYAADSGAEHAIWNLKYGGLEGTLKSVGSYVSYTLDESINGLPVEITVTKQPSSYSIVSSAGDRVLNASVNITGGAVIIESWYIE